MFRFFLNTCLVTVAAFVWGFYSGLIALSIVIGFLVLEKNVVFSLGLD